MKRKPIFPLHDTVAGRPAGTEPLPYGAPRSILS